MRGPGVNDALTPAEQMLEELDPMTPADRIIEAHKAAEAALQSVCLSRGVRLAPDLANDLVCLLAAKDVASWKSYEKCEQLSADFDRMNGVLQIERVATEDQVQLLKRAMAFTLRAKRHWLAQFCPVCWMWTGLLWVLGFRGPTSAEADHVAHGD